MATSYKTACDLCFSSFNTTNALQKHRNSKHPKARQVKELPFKNGDEVISCWPSGKSKRNTYHFKAWLAGVTESINSTLHPKSCSKWSRIERLDVPEEYLHNILRKMPSAFVNQVQERCHFKAPVFKEKAIAITYRVFDTEEVRAAFNHQPNVELQLQKSYLGDELATLLRPRLTGRAAIEAAKAQVHWSPASLDLQIPSMEVKIVIGHGEGRATREFDLIWWPNMFATNGHGKLVLRYYVAKVRL